MFTAGDVFRSIVLLAPRLRAEPPEPMVIASAFNAALADLISDVVDTDAERLAARYTVPSWVVSQNPVDLTLAGDQDNPTTREWLRILYVDWKDAAGEGDEVWITTIEARNRAAHDYDGVVVATASDQLRKLYKVSGWEGVHTLEVYGVLAPEEVTARTIDSAQFDYPRAVRDALRWELLLQLSAYAAPDGGTVQYWEAKRSEARSRLLDDVAGHMGSRIEDQPLYWEW